MEARELQPSELRIGNLVTTVEGTKHYQKELEVELITNNNYELDGPLDLINGYEPREVLPIPLTEEWILRFGFASNPYEDRYELQTFYVECDKTRGCLHLCFLAPYVELKYVHRLQNLYFALTGEELKQTK